MGRHWRWQIRFRRSIRSIAVAIPSDLFGRWLFVFQYDAEIIYLFISEKSVSWRLDALATWDTFTISLRSPTYTVKTDRNTVSPRLRSTILHRSYTDNRVTAHSHQKTKLLVWMSTILYEWSDKGSKRNALNCLKGKTRNLTTRQLTLSLRTKFCWIQNRHSCPEFSVLQMPRKM